MIRVWVHRVMACQLLVLLFPSMIEEPGTSLVPQEVHPPQEALFGDRRIFVLAPQFDWHDYSEGAMDVDRDAKNQIMDLADLLHTFGHRTEA